MTALYACARMIDPKLLLILATILLVALIALFGFGIYFAFRFLTTIAILKAAPDAKSAAAMLRAAGEPSKVEDPAKKPMEMPATGVDELANSPAAISNLRKRQDPSPDLY